MPSCEKVAADLRKVVLQVQLIHVPTCVEPLAIQDVHSIMQLLDRGVVLLRV